MTKEERELREAMRAKKDEAKRALKEDKLDEAEAFDAEYREMERKLNLMGSVNTDLPELEERKLDNEPKTKEVRTVADMTAEEVEKAYTGTFLKAIRKKQLNGEDMEIFERVKEMRAVPEASPYLNSNVDENGGLIVPEDIQTKINQYKRQGEFELQSLVSTETVSTRSGSRVFEKLSNSTPFVQIDEWDTIPEVDAPTFEQKSYNIKDYAGILPIPNRMLQDTDAALMDTIARFIARKSVITRNTVLLSALDGLVDSSVAFEDVDSFKDVLNVQLDPAFTGGAKVVTNQDGFNVLDKMKNEQGEYILQPDATSPTGKSLLGKAVVVVPNRTLVSAAEGAPVFVGELAEAIVLFDRNVYELKGTDVGGRSFTRNSYDIRVIDRFDVQTWDAEAVIAGHIPLGVVAP